MVMKGSDELSLGEDRGKWGPRISMTSTTGSTRGLIAFLSVIRYPDVERQRSGRCECDGDLEREADMLQDNSEP